jgi:DNA-binding MarR family transcriptional regulator
MGAGEKKDELRVEPPQADRPPRSVGFLISQLGFVSAKGFREALQPAGIDPREFLLLRFVAASSGPSQQALAERLGIPPSRMVALVDRLEEQGLVERRPDAEDRRVRALYLTRKGSRVLDRAAKIAIEYELSLCSGLEGDERDQLIDLLQKLQRPHLTKRGVHPGLGKGPGQFTD